MAKLTITVTIEGGTKLAADTKERADEMRQHIKEHVALAAREAADAFLKDAMPREQGRIERDVIEEMAR